MCCGTVPRHRFSAFWLRSSSVIVQRSVMQRGVIPARGGHSRTGAVQTAAHRTGVQGSQALSRDQLSRPAKQQGVQPAQQLGARQQGQPASSAQQSRGDSQAELAEEIKRRTLKISLPRGNSYTRIDLAKSLEKEKFDLKDIEALGTQQQNNVWYITFKSEELAGSLLSEGVLVVAGKTGYVSALDHNAHRVRIHWAPYFLSQQAVLQTLSSALPEMASIENWGYEKSQIKNLEHVATMVRFVVIKYPGPTSDLPHLLKVKEGNESHEILLTITGRQPICFKCKEVGHTRGNCMLCSLCGSRRHIAANCPGQTYATVSHTTEMTMEADDVVEETPEEREALERDRAPDATAATLGTEDWGMDQPQQGLQSMAEAIQLRPEDFPPLGEVTRAVNLVKPGEGEMEGTGELKDKAEEVAIGSQFLDHVTGSLGDTQKDQVPLGQVVTRSEGEETVEMNSDDSRLLVQTSSEEEDNSGDSFRLVKPKKRKKDKNP